MVGDPKWPVKFSRQQFVDFSKDCEGGPPEVDFMFMVQDKQVATAYGITWYRAELAAAGKEETKRLVWLYKPGHPNAGSTCDRDDVEGDYDRVLAAPAAMSDTNGHLDFWSKLAICRATVDSLKREVHRRVLVNANIIRNTPVIKNFDKLPGDAQMCVISVTWARGASWHKTGGAVRAKLDRFVECLEKMDFEEAKKHTTYGDNFNSLPKRGKHQIQMLDNAKAVASGRGSFEECYFPAKPPMGGTGIVSGIAGPPSDVGNRFRGLGIAGRITD